MVDDTEEFLNQQNPTEVVESQMCWLRGCDKPAVKRVIRRQVRAAPAEEREVWAKFYEAVIFVCANHTPDEIMTKQLKRTPRMRYCGSL